LIQFEHVLGLRVYAVDSVLVVGRQLSSTVLRVRLIGCRQCQSSRGFSAVFLYQLIW